MLGALLKHVPEQCSGHPVLAMHARTHATYRELLTFVFKTHLGIAREKSNRIMEAEGERNK
jgi:hypothetical protein